MLRCACNRGERRFGVECDGGKGVGRVSGSIVWGAGESEWGVGWKPTLGSAALAGEGAGVCLVGAGWAAATAKMSASFWMASIWASPMDVRGEAWAGLRRVDGCTNGSISGGELRHFAVVQKKLHRTGNAFCSRFGGIDLVAPVVFRCSS
jgi:hypothetical protein